MLTIVSIVLILNVICLAQPQSLLTRHVREATISGEAKSMGRLPAEQTMRLVLVLPLRDQAGLDNLLKQLYTPSSLIYRHFLTVEEFTARFGPSVDDYQAVVAFAKANGLEVAGTSRNRVNLEVTGTVAAIEKAFHITLGTYQHPTENRTFYAPDREPTVDLPFQLWHISGLDNYSKPRPMFKRLSQSFKPLPLATTGSCPDESFCGSDMRAAYYEGTALTGSGQNLGLLEYYGTDLSDLMTYYTNAHQTYPTGVVHLVSTDGTSTSCTAASGCDDTEQTLDMTQALGMAPGLTGLYMFVGSTDTALLNGMATASPLPYQLSSSWTWSPADPNTDNPYFEMYAAQGQNFFQAAGDSGAWPSSASSFEDWPADDVYITSVGGTDLTTKSAGGDWNSETCWADGGGGPSPDEFAIPSWQTAAATSCKSADLGCSTSYRNGPDVSANANFTFYVCADQTTCTANSYGGTSFAAPMWAGYLALVNENRISNYSLKSIGFFNPLIYPVLGESGYDTAFHDITSGSNGHSAGTGYDLCSGLGSPNTNGIINCLAGAYSIAASPTTVSVAQGSSGTSRITSTITGGYDEAVAFTASGEPTGVTVSFSPSSVSGAGTSTATFAVGSSVATGSYTITITGTPACGAVETTTVTLTVTSAASFSLSSSPSSVSVAQGSSGTSTITSTVTGSFDSAVSLSASGQPTGVTVTFSPTSITGTGTSTMTMAVASTTTVGTYTITVTGTGGGQTKTTTVSLTVTSPLIATTTTISNGSPNPSTGGQTVSWTVTVTAASGPTPTGTVTVKSGTTAIGSANLSSGRATVTAADLPAGTYSSITATYNGSTKNAASTSSAVSQTVTLEPTASTLTTSPNPSTAGEAVTLTCKVTDTNGSTPVGDVAYYIGSTELKEVAETTGTATYSYAFSKAGTYSLSCRFGATTRWGASTSATVTQTVNAASVAKP